MVRGLDRHPPSTSAHSCFQSQYEEVPQEVYETTAESKRSESALWQAFLLTFIRPEV